MSRASARLARTKDSGFELAPRAVRDLGWVMDRLFPFDPLLNLDRPAIGERCAAAAEAAPGPGPTAALRSLLAGYTPRWRESRITARRLHPDSRRPPALRSEAWPEDYTRVADAELSTRQYHTQPSSHVLPNYREQWVSSAQMFNQQMQRLGPALGAYFSSLEGVPLHIRVGPPVVQGGGLRPETTSRLRWQVQTTQYRDADAELDSWGIQQSRRFFRDENAPSPTSRILSWANLQAGAPEAAERVRGDARQQQDDFVARGMFQSTRMVLGRPGFGRSQPNAEQGRQAYEDRIDAQRVRMQVEQTERYWNAPGYLPEELHEAEPTGYHLSGDPTPAGKGDPLAEVYGATDRLLSRISELVDDCG